jgi:hypothetical protein
MMIPLLAEVVQGLPGVTGLDIAHWSDRAIFLGAIVVLGKYFMKQHNDLICDFKEHRKSCEDDKKVLNDERKKENAEFARVVDASNHSREGLATTLQEVSKQMSLNTEMLTRVGIHLSSK